MSATTHAAAEPLAVGVDPEDRIADLDWNRVTDDLAAQGSSVMKGLLPPDECRSIEALYCEDGPFRSRVIMGRHGFGRGEYKYFAYPLPNLIAGLRTALYAKLAPIANHWNGLMRDLCAKARFWQGRRLFWQVCLASAFSASDRRQLTSRTPGYAN